MKKHNIIEEVDTYFSYLIEDENRKYSSMETEANSEEE